jgi:flagellar M-ring protein FliF
MAGFRDTADQAKNFWLSRNGRQKAFLLGGTAGTLLLVALFAHLLIVPDYKPLFTDMDPADAQKLVAQLDAQNIPHQLSADGKTVSVPADKLAAARLQSASQGEPHSGRMGFELFDKMSWGQTEFDEKVAYQRAMEGELERTIQTLAEVERARVHLVMPTDSVFLDRQRTGKASVILKLRHNGLSKDAVLAISRLVAGAVDELKPEDVAIIDADSDRSLGLGHDGALSGESEEARLTERLINTLEPVVGANRIRASVNVDYDQGTTEKSQEEYDPTVSAVLSSQKTEDQATGGSVPMGVPGTASNMPSAKTAKSAAASTTPTPTQSSKSENEQYGVDKTIVHTVTPAGRIERITAAILVDDEAVKGSRGGKISYTRQPRSSEELAKIRDLAQAAIGFDANRGDVINVQDMSFNADAAESDVPAPNWASQIQKTVLDYSAIARPVSLLAIFLLAYLFMLRPIQKHALRPNALESGMQPALSTTNRDSLPMGTAEIESDNQRASQLKEQALELVRQKPADTARALRAWVREDQS